MEGNHPFGKGAGAGFRVWKIRVNKDNREILKKVFRDVTSKKAKTKGFLRYIEEWENTLKEVLEARARARKRTPPLPPPVFLLVRFVVADGKERGNKNAPCIIDLKRGELRIPSYGIRLKLRASLVKALAEENELTPRPDFVLQLTARGKLRIIAKRALPPPELRAPLRVIAVDENSRYGFAIAAFDFEDRGCKLAYFEKLRPESHGYKRQLAAALQSFASAPSGDRRTRLSQLLGQELANGLTPERARELAALARRKERRLNDAFVRRVTAVVRRLVREAAKEGRAAVILVDPIDYKSLEGTGLQGTLLRARRALENLARYEGAFFVEARASGRQCPHCGSWGTEVRRTARARVYKCWRCGAVWDRDKGALCNLAAAYFEKLRKHGNGTAERALASLKQWLKRHPRALEY